MSWQVFVHRILPISSLLLVVLFKFENCAPSSAISSVQAQNGGVVGVIDNFNQTPVTFVANPQLVEPSAQGLMVQGLCVGGTNDQTIEYQVIDMRTTPQIVSAGQVICQGGGFELPVANLSLSNCTDTYEVRAARSGQPSQVAITNLQLDCASQTPTVKN